MENNVKPRNRTFYVTFMVAIMISEVVATFETTMIFSAMSKLVVEYGDLSTAGWLVTGYLLTAAGVVAIVGRLGDIYGRRNLLLLLLVVGIFGSLISAVSANYATVLIGRCLQGLTAALVPLLLGLIREHIPEKHVSISIGFVTSAAGFGAISGLLVGGQIVDNFNWRWIFVASAVLGVIATVAVYLFIPDPKRKSAALELQWISGVMFVPGIACVLLALSRGAAWGWTSFPVLGSFVLGVSLLCFWASRSYKEENPMVNVRLFENADLSFACVAVFLIALGGLQIIQVFALLIQQPEWTGVGLGLTATHTGLLKLPSNILSLAGGPLAGILLARIGSRYSLSIAGSLITLGWCLSLFFHDTAGHVVALLMLISFGATMAVTILPDIVVKSVPESNVSEATGLLNVVRVTSMAIGAQLIAIVLSADTVSQPTAQDINFPTKFAYQVNFGFLAFMSALVVLLALPRRNFR